MGLSLDYVARETGTNLWRNRLMTVAAVLTVAVSLSLVGAALLLKQGVSTATVRWKGGVQLAVFMQPQVPPDQTQAVAQRLGSMTEVKRTTYCDQACSYREFRTMFANQPDLVNSATAADLPPSFRVVARDANHVQEVGSAVRSFTGVRNVVYAKQSVDTLLRVTGIAQAVLFSVAVVLLAAAAVLILNAIRMAIFARRREVAVMKLVGATNWFIRVPYMLEGVIQGLAGAAVAVGVVAVVSFLLRYSVQHYDVTLFQSIVVSGRDLFLTEIAVLFMGAVVGAGGSALGVRRFLEV
ncbi:MAG TPA: permease-like cell division protein FtsX [Acidimicrobiales bacterium]|jgi:cell division transport system permease protein|nr:permease-like cell division protein FtsX [Acidimicrobiales bacterium]